MRNSQTTAQRFINNTNQTLVRPKPRFIGSVDDKQNNDTSFGQKAGTPSMKAGPTSFGDKLNSNSPSKKSASKDMHSVFQVPDQSGMESGSQITTVIVGRMSTPGN